MEPLDWIAQALVDIQKDIKDLERAVNDLKVWRGQVLGYCAAISVIVPILVSVVVHALTK